MTDDDSLAWMDQVTDVQALHDQATAIYRETGASEGITPRYQELADLEWQVWTALGEPVDNRDLAHDISLALSVAAWNFHLNHQLEETVLWADRAIEIMNQLLGPDGGVIEELRPRWSDLLGIRAKAQMALEEASKPRRGLFGRR